MTTTPPSQNHSGAAAHYDLLLAGLYAWMVGDLVIAEQRALDELRDIEVMRPPPRARVLDLGAGLGLHAVPLAMLGWDVTAIDSSQVLLHALALRAPKVHVVHGDLVHAAEYVTGELELILCMGDTLTHLDSEDAVDLTLAGAARRLALGGRLVLRFRDYVTRRLLGAERFLLVRADATRILTCCLDFESQRVLVTDVVHERTETGWTLRASSYRKLRLRRDKIVDALTSHGLDVTVVEVAPPWIHIVATRLEI